jgi:hypothetical protein
LDAVGEFGGVLGLDQVQVVDPGPDRLGGCGVVGSGLGVDVASDDVRDRVAHGAAVPADLDPGQVERVEDELDLAPDQHGVDLVLVGVQPDGGGLGDGAPLRPQERLPQLRRRRHPRGER